MGNVPAMDLINLGKKRKNDASQDLSIALIGLCWFSCYGATE